MNIFNLIIGRHCCLFCHATKAESQTNVSSDPRTLETLDNDLERYNANGEILGDAKLFNNVITERLLDIPISQVHMN